LVVLSACETGLGDIYDTEGVFGLQRAFKAAGVDQLLISLWKVPDQQTLELMQYFYKFYLKTEDAAEALHQAQLKMSKKYRAYYWGAFVLMD
jgi:CHAT domain-containing protein